MSIRSYLFNGSDGFARPFIQTIYNSMTDQQFVPSIIKPTPRERQGGAYEHPVEFAFLNQNASSASL